MCIAVAILLSILATRSAPAADAYYLIDNFSSPLPDEPGLSFSVDTANPKVGLGALKVDYVLPADRRPIDFTIPEKRWILPAAGNIVFWLKGDQSDTELQFTMMTSQFRTEADGHRSLINAKAVELHPVKADPAAKGNCGVNWIRRSGRKSRWMLQSQYLLTMFAGSPACGS